jgi:hypothetical protein
MEQSVYLAQLIGTFLTIAGLAALMSREHFKKAAFTLYKNYAFLMAVALLELLAGLAIVLSHNVWTGWQAIITLFGWGMVAEGIFWLFSPESFRKIRKSIMKKNIYYTTGVIAVLLGACLMYHGFMA